MIALGGADIASWLVDTFVITALLIGLILLVRRRVAELFGPQIAYSLWALPLLRFVMPPLVLPAWMQPALPVAEAAPVAAGGESAAPVLVYLSAPDAAVASPSEAPWFDLTLTDILLPLWLGGAAIFLALRVRGYVRMRRDLLARARPVGEAGKVRLVETPAVTAPVAFGIRDKVVALPPEFMDRIDVTARDMAIAHELEHHRGHDLLANIAAQPLLALHWLNPLAWWGWRAMRRDQEAACDARVVAGRARSERAAYAEVIAGFAAGQHLALAAPMACPVLGEKSIIHRLRSLTMTDISARRRRIGIAALATTALALPLTASISYAQAEPVDPPAAPAAPQAPGAPDVPQPPAAPPVGEPVGDPEVEVVVIDGEQVITISHDSVSEDGERHVTRRVIRRPVEPGTDGSLSESELDELLAELDGELADLDREIERNVERNVERVVFVSRDGRAPEIHELRGVEPDCSGGQTVEEVDLGNGRRAMMICTANIEMQAQAHAADGLRAAMASIENNPQIPAETRREILRELERAVEEMEAANARIGAVSSRAMPKVPGTVQPPQPPVPPRVTFGFTVTPRPAPAAARVTPMAHPLTGRVVSEAVEDCPETRVPVRATA